MSRPQSPAEIGRTPGAYLLQRAEWLADQEVVGEARRCAATALLAGTPWAEDPRVARRLARPVRPAYRADWMKLAAATGDPALRRVADLALTKPPTVHAIPALAERYGDAATPLYARCLDAALAAAAPTVERLATRLALELETAPPAAYLARAADVLASLAMPDARDQDPVGRLAPARLRRALARARGFAGDELANDVAAADEELWDADQQILRPFAPANSTFAASELLGRLARAARAPARAWEQVASARRQWEYLLRAHAAAVSRTGPAGWHAALAPLAARHAPRPGLEAAAAALDAAGETAARLNPRRRARSR